MGKDVGEPARDVKRSASGRVPQWAMDEALGRATEPPPFRAAPSGARPTGSKGRKVVVGGIAVVVVGSLAAATAVFGLPDSSQSGASLLTRPRTTQASAPPPQASSAPPPGHEERAVRLLPAATDPTGGEGASYRFSAHQKGLPAPVTWSPCRPLHFVVRPQGQPAFGEKVVADAVAALRAATGLDLVDDGFTSEAPVPDREAYQPAVYGNRWAPVLISWASASEVPDFGIDVTGRRVRRGSPQRRASAAT